MWRIVGSRENSQRFSRIDLVNVNEEVISVGTGPNRLRIACISDTHSEEESIVIPEADLLVFAGDALNFSSWAKHMAKFYSWISAVNCRDKVLVAGNHDLYISRNKENIETILPGIKYLEDSSVSVGLNSSVTVYGAPWTVARNLFYPSSAFSLPEDEILAKWKRVPTGVDILVTHSPPWGVLDMTYDRRFVGSEYLRNEIADRIHPKIHIFGHNHDAHAAQMGTFANGDKCLFVNASAMYAKSPIMIDYMYEKKEPPKKLPLPKEGPTRRERERESGRRY